MKPPRASLVRARREVEQALRRTGYTAMKAKHGKVRPVEFPDLSVKPGYPSLGNGIAKATPLKQMPADAKQFPVGHSHKQGLQLITPGTDPQWMGGKKT